jgi:hypothetical protein
LTNSELLGSVHGHDVALTQVVAEVKEYLQWSPFKIFAQPVIKLSYSATTRP